MAYSDYLKSQVKHHRCFICGQTFGAQYDEVIKTYPVFHPSSGVKRVVNCEDVFFKEILRIYRYLHESSITKTVRNVLEEFPWSSRISMRKELVEWCMRMGYFDLNSLKRIQVPPAVEDSCKEVFADGAIDDPKNLKSAIELVKAALRCFSGDLLLKADREFSFTKMNFDRGQTTLYDNIDTSNVDLRSQRGGMATANNSGAKDIDKRMHAANSTMERRRMDDN